MSREWQEGHTTQQGQIIAILGQGEAGLAGRTDTRVESNEARRTMTITRHPGRCNIPYSTAQPIVLWVVNIHLLSVRSLVERYCSNCSIAARSLALVPLNTLPNSLRMQAAPVV